MVKSDLIANFMQENNLNRTNFANECNMAIYTLDKVLNGDIVNYIIMFKIAKFMKTQIKDLLTD